ncbi:MAG: CpaF/VirB11 family protein [Bacillales bacterium]|nr:CpaF/VirB11 family protein [Bacillales bacterium]
MEDRNESLKEYLKSSFLKNIDLDAFTDITFNGNRLVGESIEIPRIVLIEALDNQIVGDFLMHLAHLLGKNFNTLNPILDIAFLNYRLNAIHPIIARDYFKGVYNFSLRIFSAQLKIKEDDKLLPNVVQKLLKRIIQNRISLLISGITGSGKTEFQKYLVSLMSEGTRVVMIEDTYETYLKELFPKLDILEWVTFNNQENLKNDISKLIRSALRNNPDWLIVAEMRGEEAEEVYNSLTTGHPLITTIHSLNALKTIDRLAYLLKIIPQDTQAHLDLIEYTPLAIHLTKKVVEGKTIRYVSQIVEYISLIDSFKKNIIYSFDGKKANYLDLSDKMKRSLNYENKWFETN